MPHAPSRQLQTIRRAACVAAFLVLWGTGAEAQQQENPRPTSKGQLLQLVAHLRSNDDEVKRRIAIDSLIARMQSSGGPLTEDSTALFLFQGKARRVGVAGDLNEWNPAADSMTRVAGSDLFYLLKTLNPASRIEYKLAVDSTWVLDPLNPRHVMGGFGPNSELRMGAYRPPADIESAEGVRQGKLDTLSFASSILNSAHPLIVYLPSSYNGSTASYPLLIVTDGGEYLSLAQMRNILDNHIADGSAPPLIAAFIDPRTDPTDPRTSTRMTDYAMSDSFVESLIKELRPLLLKRYRILDAPAQTGIMGASMGGLIATYAALRHPEVFGFCAAQSPAYQWKKDAILALARTSPRRAFRIYLDTGTISDAQVRARLMRDIMTEKGYDIVYAEYPEAHNWANWRSRVGSILKAFGGRR
ncbi:MAG TPA: alpha/beta hydrolase-fold protein [Bacteroidota bacterium]|nr:alpha/beta hydrolase-fold protein [Bacteroidota bacterium]